MAQTRLISDLVELITPNNDDVFVIVDNTTNPSLSVTKKISYASLKEDLQDMIDALVSGDTSIATSYVDNDNTIVLSVVADTTVQKGVVSTGGTNVGARREVNFIAGSGITLSGVDNSTDNRVDLTVKVNPAQIAITDLDTSSPLSVNLGGTGGSTAQDARNNLGAAKSGSNSDITSLTGLTTALSVSQGGTGGATAQNALKNLEGLKYIANISADGEGLVKNQNALVNNEYRGELKGLKGGSTKVSISSDASNVYVDVDADNILNGSTSDIDLNNHRIQNLGTPLVSSDAATRAYVDQVAGGLTVKQAVLAASTTNLASTYSGGTLTVTGTGVPSIDGVSIDTLGTRVLIKEQTDGVQNGIYTLTTAAASGVSAVFTRATDYDESVEVAAGTFLFVISGSTNASLQFAQLANTPTIDVDPLVFTVLNDSTIGDNAVANAKLADMQALRIKGAVTAGDPQDLSPNQVIGILNSGSTLLKSNVLPTGTTGALGIVQLYNGVNSQSTSLAATANSVKTAYDAATNSAAIASAKPSLAVVLALG